MIQADIDQYSFRDEESLSAPSITFSSKMPTTIHRPLQRLESLRKESTETKIDTSLRGYLDVLTLPDLSNHKFEDQFPPSALKRDAATLP